MHHPTYMRKLTIAYHGTGDSKKLEKESLGACSGAVQVSMPFLSCTRFISLDYESTTYM